MKIIGITGTNGKTTCVHLICNLLKDSINCASFGTLGIKHYKDNICLTTPTTLTTLGNVDLHNNLTKVSTANCEVVAMEVSSHGLDQKRVAGVDFSVAVFTNLSHDHLDYHKDLENYFQAKVKLFTVYNKKLKVAIINLDDDYGVRLIKLLQSNKQNCNSNNTSLLLQAGGSGTAINNQLEIIGFSVESTNNVINKCKVLGINAIKLITCENILCNNLGIQASINTPWGVDLVTTTLLGKHNLSNLLVGIAVSSLFLPFKEVVTRCKNLEAPTGRLQLVASKPHVIVDYAHTPDALEKTLSTVQQHHPNKKICCIFGCGGNRDHTKRPKMLEIANKYCNVIILTQDNSRFEDPKQIINDILSYKNINSSITLIVELDRKAAIHKAIEKYHTNYIIVIAGKGHETKQIIGDKEYPFCDFDVAQEALYQLR